MLCSTFYIYHRYDSLFQRLSSYICDAGMMASTIELTTTSHAGRNDHMDPAIDGETPQLGSNTVDIIQEAQSTVEDALEPTAMVANDSDNPTLIMATTIDQSPAAAQATVNVKRKKHKLCSTASNVYAAIGVTLTIIFAGLAWRQSQWSQQQVSWSNRKDFADWCFQWSVRAPYTRQRSADSLANAFSCVF